jgi:hypothetical protein
MVKQRIAGWLRRLADRLDDGAFYDNLYASMKRTAEMDRPPIEISTRALAWSAITALTRPRGES